MDINVEDIARILNAKRSGSQWLARCPAHDDRDASFRFGVKDGKFLAHCYAGCTFEEIMIALGLSEGFHVKSYKPERQEDYARNRQKVSELLARCTEAKDSPIVHAYFESRGIGRIVHDWPTGNGYSPVKFVDSLEYWDTDGDTPIVKGSFPCMVNIHSDEQGEIVSLHRTYLAYDGSGKAPVDKARKMMPATRRKGAHGAAIKLYQPTDSLAVAEGIETALAFRLLSGIPVWSCVSASGLERIQIPRSVKHVYIVADNDRSGTGQRAAKTLLERIRHDHRVTVCTPREMGQDMLDAYNAIKLGN